MSLLFETIRLEDGVFMNLEFHNLRLNKSREELLGEKNQLFLENEIVVPSHCKAGIYKCKVSYSSNVNEIEIIPYQKRVIESLKLVEDNTISYSHKYSDRSHLLELMNMRGDCDDILIVKDGYITDTSFSNIVFFDGEKWVTPARPLLRGTMRESLLKRNLIGEENITVDDLNKIKEARLINAMLPLETGTAIQVENIRSQR
jgi:4-amino-4-deoxychorismate lyase